MALSYNDVWIGYPDEAGAIVTVLGRPRLSDGPGIVISELPDGSWAAEIVNCDATQTVDLAFPNRAAADAFAQEWARLTDYARQ